MQARFYLPMYGRFASPDPARDQHFEETQSWNIYSYCQNQPTMKIDPTGMFGDDPGKEYTLTIKFTHYCSCPKCCGRQPDNPNYGRTADGTMATEGTLAADWSVIPKNSTVTWTGDDGEEHTGTVHDTGKDIKGNRIDIWTPDHQDAKTKGTYTAEAKVKTPPKKEKKTDTKKHESKKGSSQKKKEEPKVEPAKPKADPPPPPKKPEEKS